VERLLLIAIVSSFQPTSILSLPAKSIRESRPTPYTVRTVNESTRYDHDNIVLFYIGATSRLVICYATSARPLGDTIGSYSSDPISIYLFYGLARSSTLSL
jgi:hypothetical protein